MKAADHVITCTPYLDKFVRQYNTQTTDISSTIDTDRYHPKTSYSGQEPLRIGWSGSLSTAKYLHLLDGVFVALAKEVPFKLVVMGDASFTLPGVDVEAMAWREEIEIPTIRSFDIGVYPLPDEEWVLGKSGLKALQYMAAGVPTVATAIGTIFRIIEDRENGFLVSSPEQWRAVLQQLLKDPNLRERIGRNAVKTVRESYSINANKATYLSVLNRLLGPDQSF
jgi:glycosyltransferase involved in cell wall biosynthesis